MTNPQKQGLVVNFLLSGIMMGGVMHVGRWETVMHHLMAEKIAPGMPGPACLECLL